MKRAAWILLATTSFVLAAVFGPPALANYLAPLVPLRVERSLGAAIDADIRELLNDEYGEDGEDGEDDEAEDRRADSFACGSAEGEEPGRMALNRLVTTLGDAAALAFPLDITVVRDHHEVNAFALPGGHVYIFEGLIDEVENVDELAGVIGHEVGHIAHRDGMRTILQAYGLSSLFAMLPPELLRARDLLQLSYSRHRELAADRYSVALLEAVGADARAVATFLPRVGEPIPGMEILSDHPDTDARINVIEDLARTPASPVRLLDAGQWDALKRICAG